MKDLGLTLCCSVPTSIVLVHASLERPLVLTGLYSIWCLIVIESFQLTFAKLVESHTAQRNELFVSSSVELWGDLFQ